ncbi:MAG TPA: hydroxymethylbilane synthase [Actinomycetota bacterium]|nr:hydroxymethylbilane synthase [Actinomycetota bacterium]
MPDRIVLASRGSKLALAQARTVADLITRAHPAIQVEIKTVRTRGDRDRRPFHEIGGKGIFMGEVEREVVEGAADLAVHSAKDLTDALHPDCTLAAVPVRVDARDVVVGGRGETGEDRLGSLPEGASVGTSSLRRRSLLLEARPDLRVVELRGNLDTRLRKVADGEVDAAILAAAGIARLGLTEEVRPATLDPSWWVPAPAQGALAIEARRDRADVADLVGSFDDPAARAEVECERAFGRRIEGGCSIPVGCRAEAGDGRLLVTGFLGRTDGTYSIRDRISGPLGAAAEMGRDLAEAILAGGGEEILEDVRAGDAP